MNELPLHPHALKKVTRSINRRGKAYLETRDWRDIKVYDAILDAMLVRQCGRSVDWKRRKHRKEGDVQGIFAAVPVESSTSSNGNDDDLTATMLRQSLSSEKVLNMLQTMASANVPDDRVLEAIHFHLRTSSNTLKSEHCDAAVSALEPLRRSSRMARRVHALISSNAGQNMALKRLEKRLSKRGVSYAVTELSSQSFNSERDEDMWEVAVANIHRHLQGSYTGNGVGSKFCSSIVKSIEESTRNTRQPSLTSSEDAMLCDLSCNIAVKAREFAPDQVCDSVIAFDSIIARCKCSYTLKERIQMVAEVLAGILPYQKRRMGFKVPEGRCPDCLQSLRTLGVKKQLLQDDT